MVKQYVKKPYKMAGVPVTVRFIPRSQGCTTSLEVKYAYSSHGKVLQSK
jgi:hypothetical protein